MVVESLVLVYGSVGIHVVAEVLVCGSPSLYVTVTSVADVVEETVNVGGGSRSHSHSHSVQYLQSSSFYTSERVSISLKSKPPGVDMPDYGFLYTELSYESFTV